MASAIASRNLPFRDAILAEASREVDAAVLDDAAAAAALISMTNIYYRFRHLIGKPGYSEKAARLYSGNVIGGTWGTARAPLC